MFKYSVKKRINTFKSVRVLSSKDLYQKCGPRVCTDKEDFVGFSRNPLERMDSALSRAESRVSEADYQEYLKSLQAQEEPKSSEPSSE